MQHNALMIIIFLIQSSMAAIKTKGTFWVIEGVKVQKKQPFTISYISRKLPPPPPPVIKPEPVVPQVSTHPIQVPIGRAFFTEKSYEDLHDKRMDYGAIRFSSLSEIRGSDLFPYGKDQDGSRNFTPYSGQSKSQPKCELFLNQFSRFQYDDSASEQNKGPSIRVIT